MLILLLITLLSYSYSADPRPGSLTALVTGGPDQYQSFSLDSFIGLNQKLAFLASYQQSDSGTATALNEKLISREIRVGADWEINDIYSTAIELMARQDPYEVRSRGAGLSGRGRISEWWKGKRDTFLRLKFQQLQYSQNLTVQGPFKSLEFQRTVTQNMGTLGLEQEILDWLSLSISYNRYNYSDEANNLASTTSRRRTTWGGGRGISYGLPDRSTTFELILNPLEWIEARLSNTASKILNDDTNIKTNALGLSFFWKDFEIIVEVSQVNYGDTSGDDGNKQTFSGAGIGYMF
jgi:hypothetical protein